MKRKMKHLNNSDEFYHPKLGWLSVQQAREQGVLKAEVEKHRESKLWGKVDIELSPEVNNEILHEAKREFAFRFTLKSESWFKRSCARFEDVTEVKRGLSYVVRGRKPFGDKYRTYKVYYKGFDYRSEERFFCSCMYKWKKGARKREKKLCTHVGAVILFRIYQDLLKKPNPQTKILNSSKVDIQVEAVIKNGKVP